MWLWINAFKCFSSIPLALSWIKYISWLKYANEAMTIVQWEGITNISKYHLYLAVTLTKFSIWILFYFMWQLVISKLNCLALDQLRIFIVNLILLKMIFTLIFMHWQLYMWHSMFLLFFFCGSELENTKSLENSHCIRTIRTKWY